MNALVHIRNELRNASSPERAKINAWFFKTKPGEYGHGDVFIGVAVPDIRRIVKNHKDTSIEVATELVLSPIHEERLLGLLLLVQAYKRAVKAQDEKEQKSIYTLYLRLAKKHINNWDLVDLSARDIVGEYIFAHESTSGISDTLVKLAHSENMWERRIAIIASWIYIRHNSTAETFTIVGLLMHDTHDLIHKATGWMLRECWKRDPKATETFLHKHRAHLTRTTLRYAIERMEPEWRKEFMRK